MKKARCSTAVLHFLRAYDFHGRDLCCTTCCGLLWTSIVSYSLLYGIVYDKSATNRSKWSLRLTSVEVVGPLARSWRRFWSVRGADDECGNERSNGRPGVSQSGRHPPAAAGRVAGPARPGRVGVGPGSQGLRTDSRDAAGRACQPRASLTSLLAHLP